MAKRAQKSTEADLPEEANGPAVLGGVEMLVNWNSCLVDFYARRLLKYWAYPFALGGIRSLEGVAESAAKFESDLVGDYAAHVKELQRIVFGKERDTQSVSGEQYEERLLKAQGDAGLIIEQAKAQAERILRSAKLRAEQLVGDDEVVPHAARKRA